MACLYLRGIRTANAQHISDDLNGRMMKNLSVCDLQTEHMEMIEEIFERQKNYHQVHVAPEHSLDIWNFWSRTAVLIQLECCDDD